jgi:hypothetical protein
MEKLYIFKGYYYFIYTLGGVGSMKKMKIEEEEFLDDENIYSEDSREMLLDEDELSPEEEAFMNGYDEAG